VHAALEPNHRDKTWEKLEDNIMDLAPYLYFDGRCEEAIEFYKSALGAQVDNLTRFKEAPGSMAPAGSGDKVMHAAFRIGATTVMASDGRSQGNPVFQGFALSLTVPSIGEADRLFAALADGGQVRMPLAETFFSPRFGMAADRFGIGWTIMAAPQR
jgi:PhnB protein